MTEDDGMREDPRGSRRRRRRRDNSGENDSFGALPGGAEETPQDEVAQDEVAQDEAANGRHEDAVGRSGPADSAVEETRDPVDGAGRATSIVAARGIEDEGEIDDEDEDELPEAEEDAAFDDEDEELTLRERIEDRVYDTREWVAESRRNGLIALGVILLSGFVLVFGVPFLLGLFSGPEPAENPPTAVPQDEAQGNPSGTPGDALDLAPAENAGEVRVDIQDDGSVRVTHALGAQDREWTGQIRRAAAGPDGEQGGAGSNSATLELSSGQIEASFATVLSEDGARSWMGRILDTSQEGTTLEATQTSDPGAAALDGRVPFLRGTYVIKSSQGAGLSASGRYSDTLVDESTVERLYSEDYVTAEGEARRREWRAEYNIRGDAALLPFLVDYEPPDPQAPDPETSDPKLNGQNADGENGGEV